MTTNGYCCHRAGHTVIREIWQKGKKEGGKEARRKAGEEKQSLNEWLSFTGKFSQQNLDSEGFFFWVQFNKMQIKLFKYNPGGGEKGKKWNGSGQQLQLVLRVERPSLYFSSQELA